MPQMAPLNWLLLFFMFLMLFMLCANMMYFSSLTVNQQKSFMINNKTPLNSQWKW